MIGIRIYAGYASYNMRTPVTSTDEAHGDLLAVEETREVQTRILYSTGSARFRVEKSPTYGVSREQGNFEDSDENGLWVSPAYTLVFPPV